jgi:hypothetical protein
MAKSLSRLVLQPTNERRAAKPYEDGSSLTCSVGGKYTGCWEGLADMTGLTSAILDSLLGLVPIARDDRAGDWWAYRVFVRVPEIETLISRAPKA